MRYTGLILAAGLLAVGVISGCNEQPAASTSTSGANTAPAGESGGGGSAMGGAMGGAPASGGKVEIKYNEKDLEGLEKRLAASPDDAALKAETAEAAFQVGYTFEYGDEPPRIKYRTALKHFRRALELKPDHAQAAAEKEQIENIYKSMGRPVPE